MDMISSEVEVSGGRLNDELDKRSINDESESGYDPKIFNDDIPDETFRVAGEVYMIDDVHKSEIELRKVFITMTPTKVSIGESSEISRQMDVIYMNNVYPRRKQIMEILSRENQPTADKIDVLRIPLYNLKNLFIGGSSDMYCFTLMNSNDQSDESIRSYEQSYSSMV